MRRVESGDSMETLSIQREVMARRRFTSSVAFYFKLWFCFSMLLSMFALHLILIVEMLRARIVSCCIFDALDHHYKVVSIKLR